MKLILVFVCVLASLQARLERTKLKSTDLTPETKLKLEQLLEEDGFALGKELGKGGFGAVHELTMSLTGKKAAVKIMLYNSNQKLKELAEKETETMLAVRNLKSVLQICSYGQIHSSDQKGQIFILPKALMDLKTIILSGFREKGYLSKFVRYRVMFDVAAGLKELHSRGFIHRDIKPENFLILEGGKTMFADFGLTTKADQIANEGKAGTPTFIPYDCKNSTGKCVYDFKAETDVYALGMTFAMLNSKTFAQCFYKNICPKGFKDFRRGLVDFSAEMFTKIKEFGAELENEFNSKGESGLHKLIFKEMLVSLDKRKDSAGVLKALEDLNPSEYEEWKELRNKKEEDCPEDISELDKQGKKLTINHGSIPQMVVSRKTNSNKLSDIGAENVDSRSNDPTIGVKPRYFSTKKPSMRSRNQ